MPVSSSGGMPSTEWYPRNSGQVQNWMLYADAARPGTTQNDYLDGGGDVTSYAGGPGDDWYVVHHSTDTIAERPGEGADTVLAWADYQLAEGVDNLTLLPGPGLVATGNSVGNIIIGNDGDNTVDGGDASDDLTGGAGRDLFIERAGEADFDVVKDFESHDVVRLEGWGFASFAEVQAAMEQLSGADGQPAVRLMKTVTTPDGSISTAAVTFEHRTLADFSAANFELGAGSGDGSGGTTGGAQPTPDAARAYVAPDATGTARGSASADGQTLIGGGGDDIFHVGTLGDGGDRILDWSMGDRLGMFPVDRGELFIEQDGNDTGIYVNTAAPFEEPDLHLVASLADTAATSFDPYRDIFFV
jgi:hypothetical protein